MRLFDRANFKFLELRRKAYVVSLAFVAVGVLSILAHKGLNYGVDRVRFPTPVLVGSRVRDHITLMDFHQRAENRYFMKTNHTIEAEGEEKPAAVVEFLVLWFRELRH